MNLKKETVELRPIVAESLKMLRNSLPATIKIHPVIEERSGMVWGNPVQIQQIVMNLCTNAFHAMKSTGGIMKVAVASVDLAGDQIKPLPGIDPGSYIEISVRDTGHGIDPEIIDQIFDPYFTTKEKGLGTGLGLPVVKGIVESHGGAIRVSSEPGSGTCFSILLPRVEPAEKRDTAETEGYQMGNELILFVDDEESIVEVSEEMLEWLGYRCVSKSSGEDALEAFKAAPDTFDLVITDQTMPNMTGEELAAEITSLRPDIPIILCTGYSDMMSEQKASELGFQAFIVKPVSMENMAEIIRKVLDNA